MRKGFSLVEALVALALFQIGMLALAATTIVTARDMSAAARRSRAMALAYDRVERLRVGGCAAAAIGQAASGGFREYWRVDVAGARRMLTDTVVFSLPTGREARVGARAQILCPPSPP